MNVYVAYHDLNPAVEFALLMDGIDATFVWTKEDHDYFRLWKRLWDEGRQFILIEGDVVPWPGAIEQVWGCPESWCGFSMYIHGYLQYSLGACPKFSDDFLTATKGAMDEVYTTKAVGVYDPPDTWRGIDVRLYHVLMHTYGKHGPHLHGPAVTHLNLGHRRRVV